MLSQTVVAVRHPALRPFVHAMTGYHQEGLPAGVHRGLPSPYLTIVVTADAPLVLAGHADPRQPAGIYDAVVGGLHTRPVLIAHPGRQRGVQLSLTPLGARALLGGPAAALVSWDADLADVIGAPAVELVERFRAATDFPSGFAAVETVLLRVLRERATLGPEVAEAWRLTTTSYGMTRVADIAVRLGWSRRHLEDRFRAEIGLSPKQAARIARFDRARHLLAHRVTHGQPAQLAGLAHACGYYDQAHLTREWRSLSGLPSRGWLREELAIVQDSVPPGGQW